MAKRRLCLGPAGVINCTPLSALSFWVSLFPRTGGYNTITSRQVDGETMETVTDFIFLGSKITADGDCSHEIKRRLLLGRKAMTNLDSILKSRDITLKTKVSIVKAMLFPVVAYGCESWSIKKAEHLRIDAFELWYWRRLLRVPWITKRSNQSVLKDPFSRGSSQPRDRTQVSHIAGGFFTSWATRKSKNTGVGSLSLLQLIFPTQELNQGLLHCRWLLYQLSYDGNLIPKGNQSWIFIGRNDAESEAAIHWPPDTKSRLIKKTLMLGKIEGRKRGDDRGQDDWMASLTQWTWVLASYERWRRT